MRRSDLRNNLLAARLAHGTGSLCNLEEGGRYALVLVGDAGAVTGKPCDCCENVTADIY